MAGGFDELRIVQQHKGLQRSVGSAAAYEAKFAFGRVERGHGGRGHSAFPVGVKTSTKERLAFAVRVRAGKARPIVELQPEALGVIGIHTGATDFMEQQPANSEGIIADHLGIEPMAWAAREEAIVGVAREQCG